MEPIDIIIFGGQSNMQGQTGEKPAENTPVAGAYEYRYLQDELVELKHPVGEDIHYSDLSPSVDEGGSLVPYFCNAYIAKTGRKVVAIHCARGSTTVAEWLHGTQRHYYADKKIQAALKKAKETFEIGHIFYVWLQGESDAIIRTSDEEYKQKLIQYKNELKNELKIEKFGIIKVGYFVSTTCKDKPTAEQIEADETIMRAQEACVRSDSDFIMLTRVCPEFSRTPAYIGRYPGHYNNMAMEQIGKEAGKRLAESV